MIRFSHIQHDVRPFFPDLVQYFASRNEVECVYLYGSYARDENTPFSDIDIGVYLDSRIPSERYFDIRLSLINDAMQLLKTSEVDIVLLNQTGLQFSYSIISTGKVLYERHIPKRVAFEVQIIDRYLDVKPLLQIQEQYFLRQIEEGEVFG